MKRHTEKKRHDHGLYPATGQRAGRAITMAALAGLTVWNWMMPVAQAADPTDGAGPRTLIADAAREGDPSVPELIRERDRENARLREELRELRDRHARTLQQRDEALDLLRAAMTRRREETRDIERHETAAERFAAYERRTRQELQILRETLEQRQAKIDALERTVARLRRDREDIVAADRTPLTRVAEDTIRHETPDRQRRRDAHYNRGVLLAREGRWHEAEHEYLAALELDPRDAGTHYNLGILYHHQFSQPDRAVPHYEAFLRHKPYAPHAADVRRWLRAIEVDTR